MKKRYKVMAYHRSTGLWDATRQIKLCRIIERCDETLEADITAWQAAYNDQFRKHPYEFDWDAFNRQGAELARKIQELAPEGIETYYMESDDRDFFNPEDCRGTLASEVVRQVRN